MTLQEEPAPALPPQPSQEPVVHEGEFEGSAYRIEIYREPEEL